MSKEINEYSSSLTVFANLRLPEIGILLQPALEVREPCLHRGQGDKRLRGVWGHLGLGHREAGRKVEKVLQHFRSELVVCRGIGLQLNEPLNRDPAHMYRVGLLQSHTTAAVCCTTVASGSIEMPTWAMCEIGIEPKTLMGCWLSISCSRFNWDILNIADGFELDM